MAEDLADEHNDLDALEVALKIVREHGYTPIRHEQAVMLSAMHRITAFDFYNQDPAAQKMLKEAAKTQLIHQLVAELEKRGLVKFDEGREHFADVYLMRALIKVLPLC